MNPLAIDVLVVDEASMLDLALAARLLDAVPAPARIVLVGDRDQLAAVDPGAVFADIAGDASTLSGHVVRLTATQRYADSSPLAALAAAIRRGDAAAAIAILRAGGDTLRWLPDERALAAELRTAHAPLVDALRGGHGIDAVMRAQAGVRVLCAVREGRRGVHALNAQCEALVRGAGAADAWYPGRPVIASRNDAALQLSNGDVGIALANAAGVLQAWFAAPGGAPRAVAPARLPAHETAFATTVHKAQGSEFERVVVVLPDATSPVLTRQLLYTAVTRARTQVAVFGSMAAIAAAVENPAPRSGGLVDRLREAAPGSA